MTRRCHPFDTRNLSSRTFPDFISLGFTFPSSLLSRSNHGPSGGGGQKHSPRPLGRRRSLARRSDRVNDLWRRCSSSFLPPRATDVTQLSSSANDKSKRNSDVSLSPRPTDLKLSCARPIHLQKTLTPFMAFKFSISQPKLILPWGFV